MVLIFVEELKVYFVGMEFSVGVYRTRLKHRL